METASLLYRANDIIPIDFEFNSSNEEFVNLVCVSYSVNGFAYREWLHNDKEAQGRVAAHLGKLGQEGYTFLCFSAVAEGRSFTALGLNPHDYQWIDLYPEWKQLTYNNENREYGVYFYCGAQFCSYPPSYDARKNEGVDNNAIGYGMADMVAQLFHINIDKTHKTKMRDLIIANLPEYSPEQQVAIMDYCDSDIVYLKPSLNVVNTDHKRIAGFTDEELWNVQLNRADYMISLAKMEQEGYPILRGKIQNLRNNYESVKDMYITELVENQYPFFARKRRKKNQKRGDWEQKYEAFESFILSRGLEKEWPLTGKGKFSGEKDTLKHYSKENPEIKSLLSTRNRITQIKWFTFNPDKPNDDIFRNIGSDDRLRSFLGGYGTMTSRNAPRAKKFIPAMSAWLRSLIRPPEGYSIIGADWSSQENYIAAWMSRDVKLIEAYISGDPYLAFAKEAKAVPREANPKICKAPLLLYADLVDPKILFKMSHEEIDALIDSHPERREEYEIFKGHQEQRKLFKATVLGLSYGLGVTGLRDKLETDMGRPVTLAEAKKLVQLHKKTYHVYWDWAISNSDHHNLHKSLVLSDGWYCGPDNDNILSVRNFPVQGTGAVIMREAVKRAHKAGLRILSPLHDALYIICKDEDVEKFSKVLEKIMVESTTFVLGSDPLYPIRVDVDVHSSDDIWLEEGKAEKDYEKLSKYLEVLPPEGDTYAEAQAFLNLDVEDLLCV